jgi:pimeloyl-ACP methyl ester carboxylesterase
MNSVSQAAKDAVIVIAGCNGLATAQTWVRQLNRHAPCRCAKAFSWRDAGKVAELLAEGSPAPVTLIGHSLGGGHAQLIAERLPAGTISTLITVAPFAPPGLDTEMVRRNVGWWLNIVPARRWHDRALNLAGRFFMGWRDQGVYLQRVRKSCQPFSASGLLQADVRPLRCRGAWSISLSRTGGRFQTSLPAAITAITRV